jgi:hypothetical protein
MLFIRNTFIAMSLVIHAQAGIQKLKSNKHVLYFHNVSDDTVVAVLRIKRYLGSMTGSSLPWDEERLKLSYRRRVVSVTS